jgi:hypothetical protein
MLLLLFPRRDVASGAPIRSVLLLSVDVRDVSLLAIYTAGHEERRERNRGETQGGNRTLECGSHGTGPRGILFDVETCAGLPSFLEDG